MRPYRSVQILKRFACKFGALVCIELRSSMKFETCVFTARCYASAVLAMGLCLCLSVGHKSEFYENG